MSTQHFIQIAAAKLEETLYLFGAGEYRKSSVRLARQPLSEIENKNSVQYFTGLDAHDKPTWSNNESSAVSLFNQECVGEMSVTYNEFIDSWIMLYNCGGGINVRLSDKPWGPWSEAEIIFDPKTESTYPKGRAYGPYQLAHLATGSDTQTKIYFTMSIWEPYQVVLMTATLGKK